MTTFRDVARGDLIFMADGCTARVEGWTTISDNYTGACYDKVVTVVSDSGLTVNVRGPLLDTEIVLADARCEDCGAAVIDGHNGLVDAECAIAYCEGCIEKAERESLSALHSARDAQVEQQAYLDSLPDEDPYARMLEGTDDNPPF